MKPSPETLIDFFQNNPGRPVSLPEIVQRLHVEKSRKEAVRHLLMELVDEGRLKFLRRKYFMYPKERSSSTSPSPATGTARGRLQVTARGKGFVIRPEAEGGDLMVHASNLGSALDGDTVEVEVISGRRDREEGRVVRVIERAHEYIVGRFTRYGASGGLVAARNVKIGRMIEVGEAPPRDRLPNDAWVRVKVLKWSEELYEPLIAEIVEIIGMPGDRGISVLALLRDMGVDPAFPPELKRTVAAFRQPASAKEVERRLDLRESRILTIDPATAKDFDDALSAESLDGGGWRLGVHIADVAQYVKAGTPLDAEALRRGTSVYPVDRVVPMLPERLSDDLCSLRPRENRYALSCFMDINPDGIVLRHEIAESVICSRHRLSYEEVQEFFDAHDKNDATDDLEFADMGGDLLLLREVARCLNRMRMKRGALDLDMPERDIVCDEQGQTVEIHRHDRFESHRLVEECMLIANETVAERMKKEKLPTLYRIHDLPDPTALERLAPALGLFGLQVPKKVLPTPEFYQPLVDRLHRADGGHIGMRLILRTLMRAEYSPENKGHFGLASRCYLHFTSPIRRYPDLLVHRVLKTFLQNKSKDDSWRKPLEDSLKEIANQSNMTAEVAVAIEREASDIKAMEFMKDQVGGSFEGWISGITRKGFFVEFVDLPVEGFVLASTIQGDFYKPDEHRVRLIGRRTNHSYRLAQRVRVRVVLVNELEGQMDLELIEPPQGPSKRKGKKKSGKRR